MPITYEINKDDNLVEITIAGKVTTEEVGREMRHLMDGGDYEAGMDGLIDARDSQSDPSSVEIRELAAVMSQYRELTRHARRAIVVSEDLTYGISRIYEGYSFSNYADVKLFRDIGEARRWLAEKPGESEVTEPA